ncbi:MAG: TRAP transporter large permease [Planctomycetaceae bacterium]|nr:TRAP transporter large permease [Planctomycetaceae bacterium]
MDVFIALGLLIVLLVIGIPVALTFLLTAMFIVATSGTSSASLLSSGYRGTSSVVILTIPLFIMAGSLMNSGGIGKQLTDTVSRFVGTVRGGLGIVATVSCAVFGAISGSAAATLSSIGAIMAPRLRENGYPLGVVGALLASSGVIGMLIPPSSLMILYAWMGGQSVLAAFLAITVPGLILTTLISLTTYFMVRNNTSVRVYTAEELRTIRAEALADRKARGEWGPGPALLMPVLILGSIYGGIMTPTEAAALSVVYAVPVGFFIYKKLTFGVLKQAFVSAGIATGTIILLTITVQMLSKMYIYENMPQKILEVLTSVTANPWGIMVMVNLFMIFLGMIMDDVSATLLATPILVPIIINTGFSPIHFAAILAVNIGLGNVTPPCAPLLYFAGRIVGVDVKEMLKPTMYYITFAWLPTLAMTIFIPELSIWLPRTMGYNV